MPYCPDCGEQLHQCEIEAADPAAEAAKAEVKVAREYTDAEVEVARIQAERDIAVAKVQAGIVKDETVVEAEIATAEAEAVVDAVAPEPEEEPTPVVVVADADAEAQDEPSMPTADEQGGEPVTASSGGKNPWW